MGCIPIHQKFKIEEELVNPEDYNNDPVLILSGRRQSEAPPLVHSVYRFKSVTSMDAHNRETVRQLSDPKAPDSGPVHVAPRRRIPQFTKQPSTDSAPSERKVSIYRRQSTVEATSPPGSPGLRRKRSHLGRQHSSAEVSRVRGPPTV